MKRPKDRERPFLWGSATSSHQIEGNNRHNDWWAWEQDGRVIEKSGAACDSYNRWPEDLDIVSRLGHNAHRFSLEWSRLEPSENVWDEEAFRHYEEIFLELKARNIEPVVTLHHFTNPQWFAQKGGWLSAESVRYFLRYVQRVIKAYGHFVRFWITINEPLIYLYHSYYAGLWPPGGKDYSDAMRVFRNQLEAHMEAYRAIHHYYENVLDRTPAVSIAQHVSWYTPCRSGSFADRWAVFLRNWFANYLFLDAAITGFLFFPGIFSEFLSVRGTLDFIGLNYYTRDFIRHGGWIGAERAIGTICDKSHHADEIKENNMMGWEVHPDGLYGILKRLKRYRLPVLITENGIATSDDQQRERFIRDHLGSVERAKKEGVPVEGYFYWSLLDNFEWAHGFGPRFGVVDVNYSSGERKIRNSAHVLTEICRKLESEKFPS